MRISGVAKKGLAVVMTMALTIGAVAAAPSDASAAKKKKKAVSATVTAKTLYAAETSTSGFAWLFADGSDKNKTSTVAKKLTAGKKTNYTITLTMPNKFYDGKKKTNLGKIKSVHVFTVDLVDYLKTFKKGKNLASNVVVKCDSKTVKPKKVYQGVFEPSDHPNNYRISFFNEYGSDGDGSAKNGAKTFKCKKKITISFSITPKAK